MKHHRTKSLKFTCSVTPSSIAWANWLTIPSRYVSTYPGFKMSNGWRIKRLNSLLSMQNYGHTPFLADFKSHIASKIWGNLMLPINLWATDHLSILCGSNEWPNLNAAVMNPSVAEGSKLGSYPFQNFPWRVGHTIVHSYISI